MKKWMRDIWLDYKSEVLFGLVLLGLVAVSTYLSRFIPDAVFDHVLTPVFNTCTFTVAFAGAWLIFRHSEGLLFRKLWGLALMMWGLGDLLYLVCYFVAPLQVMNMGAEHITVFELVLGNLLGWVMTLYPTATLRPGWLTWKKVCWQLLPMAAMAALDYVIPIDLWPVIALYPYALLIFVLSHIREYIRWCEDNFSSMEHIDVQWIIRYCIMLAIIGGNYVLLCSMHGHTRGFTQQWFVILMLVYSTEQILFRKDPWKGLRDEVPTDELPTDEVLTDEVPSDKGANAAYRADLEAWLEKEKPYLNSDFQLTDLQQVLPMNRTYLSQFIKAEYGCSFYHWVNGLRIAEAKRLLTENPEMKLKDIAQQCGFSSPTVFSRVFTRETGIAPSEWK